MPSTTLQNASTCSIVKAQHAVHQRLVEIVARRNAAIGA
jgi:hypothetical protein